MIERIGVMRKQQSQSGFTLIELLVVIIILGILSAVVVFAVRGTGDKGAAAAYATDAKTIRTAQESFCANNGRYADEGELVTQKYLSTASEYHKTAAVAGTTPGAFGNCTGANVPAKSKFTLECNAAETGCGGGGALAVGGTLIVGETFVGSAAITNVASNTSGGTHAWWEIMYNGLISLDEGGNPSPELASEVPTLANGGISVDNKTYTLHLRPGVKWHDDTTAVPHTLTATDVKFTFEKVLLKYHARARNMAGPLAYDATNCVASSIAVVDPLTVTFTFTDPYAPFLKQLNVTEGAMNPANGIPGFTTGCPTQAQADAIKIGTGPFKYASFDSPQTGDGKVVKNPNYWRPGLPILDAIIMRPYPDLPDPAARYNALINGDVDWIWDVPNPNVAGLSANSNFRTASTQSLGGGPNSVDTVIFNLKASGSSVASVASGTAPDHPILGDVNVRKAIFHALNRTEFLNTGRNGIGKVSAAPISSEIFGHATDIPLPAFDVAQANALLDAAGWNGTRTTVNGTPNVRTKTSDNTTPLSIRFLQGSAIFTDRVAVIKSNLAAVGIDMPVTVNTTTANTVVFTNRNFDLYILNYAHGYDPHVGVRRQYHTDQISTTGTPNNAAGYRNPLVDADFDNAVKTLDTTARFNYYHDFQQRVVNDLPYVWMIETPNVRGFTAQCTGFMAYTGLFAESASCHR